jgi:low affinity Fe/Cu permease
MIKKLHKKLAILLEEITEFAGNPFLFAGVVLLVVGWFVLGSFVGYNDTWFDIMDVFVFLTTFFLVFSVQASQNADTRALQDKLDEIIDSLPNADDKVKAEEKRIKRGEEK